MCSLQLRIQNLEIISSPDFPKAPRTHSELSVGEMTNCVNWRKVGLFYSVEKDTSRLFFTFSQCVDMIPWSGKATQVFSAGICHKGLQTGVFFLFFLYKSKNCSFSYKGVIPGTHTEEYQYQEKKARIRQRYSSGVMCVCVCVCVSLSVVSTLCDRIDCSPPDSSIHGVLHTRILEWVAIPSSRESFWPRDLTLVSCIAGRLFTIWATRKAQSNSINWT